MAGPGFDLVVYLFAAIGGIAILAKSLLVKPKTKSMHGFRLINILGALGMLVLTYYMITRKS
jgi:hypothetical protein